MEEKLLRELIEKVSSLEKQLTELRKQNVDESLEMIPLGRVCKLLNKGYDTLMKLVDSGELEAVRFKVGKVERMMFRVADIREFQERNKGNVAWGNNDFKNYVRRLRDKFLDERSENLVRS
jgi:hypothetical protein